MTVAELIAELQKLPQDMRVVSSTGFGDREPLNPRDVTIVEDWSDYTEPGKPLPKAVNVGVIFSR